MQQAPGWRLPCRLSSQRPLTLSPQAPCFSDPMSTHDATRQCPAPLQGVANCQSYASGCACDTCNANYDKCSAQLCTDLQSDVNNCGACDSPCAAGNSCQGGTCMCDATGTCTVTSILPQVNYQAPPYPYRQVNGSVRGAKQPPVWLHPRCACGCGWQPSA